MKIRGSGFLAGAASAVAVLIPAMTFAQPPQAAAAPAKVSQARQVPAEATAAAKTKKGWVPPKTSWGHPDLQGIWTSDDMRSVPTARPAAMAGRSSLTPEEFVRRAAGDDGNLDRAVNKETVLRNEYGVRTFGYTSLVTEPADGRIPPMTPEGLSGRRRETAARSVPVRSTPTRTSRCTIAASRAGSWDPCCRCCTATGCGSSRPPRKS